MISRPKSVGVVRVEHVEQHVAREDVDAHRRDERLVRRCARRTSRRAGCSGRSRRAAPRSASPRTRRSGRSRSNRKMPIADASSAVDRLRRDRDVGLPVDVRVDQLAVVHAVEMIAGEDQVVVGVVAREVARRLPHGVGRALKPVRVVGRLLGGEDLDEPLAEEIHPVGLRDVPVERRRVELRQHEDPADVGVQAVADRDVDEAVLAADRHRRLRAELRQRKQPRALSAAEDERENFVVHSHQVHECVHRQTAVDVTAV